MFYCKKMSFQEHTSEQVTLPNFLEAWGYLDISLSHHSFGVSIKKAAQSISSCCSHFI